MSAAVAKVYTSKTTERRETRQVVFIDSGAPDIQHLLAGVQPDTMAFVLDGSRDGIGQIADILTANNLTGLSAVSIVGHGSPGAIHLGSTVVEETDLGDHAASLAHIGSFLSPHGDIALYACNLASGADGARFIATLAHLTGAEIAAATHFVGSTDLGGSWVLDASTGPVGAANPFTAQALAEFRGVLPPGATVTGTQSTTLTTDVDGDGVADPGDTVTTSVLISNAGGVDATGVNFNETLNGMTQVGAATVTPIAFDDAYSLTGNTPITFNAASGVLANDIDPDGAGGNAGLTAINVDNTGTHGTAVLNTDGSFTFTPETGFEGTTTFKYTVHDASGLNSDTTGTVTMTVGQDTWYVDSAAAAGGDGSFGHAFKTIAAAAAVDTSNDTIFVSNSGSTYSAGAGITLESGEQLLGDGSSLTSVNGHAVGNSTSNASFSVSGGTAVTLGSGNTVSGLNITGTGSAAGIVGSGNVGTLHLTDIGVTTASGAGISLTGGGTVDATGTNTIGSTTGTALNVSNTTIGAADLTFQSISSTGSSGNAGIILDTTGSLGGLHVTGTGTAGSGGTINNKTGADILTGSDASGQTTSGTNGVGIFMHSTSDASFTDMALHDFSNFAVYGNNVTGFNLDHSTISGTNGSNNAGDREEDSVRFDNLLGTATISNNSISGGFDQNVDLYNTSGTLTRLTMDSNTFGLVGSTGNDNVAGQVFNSATANYTVTNSTFAGTRADFIAFLANNNTTMDAVVRGNTFHNGQAIVPGGGTAVDIRSGSGGLNSAAHTTFDISHNTLTDGGANAFDTVGIFVAKGEDNGTMSGTIASNAIGPSKTNSNSDGIFVRDAGTGTLTTLIQNNTITGVGDNGIHLQNSDGSATLNASIYGNSVTSPTSSFPFAALLVDNGATAGPPADTSTTNVVIGTGTGGAGSQNTLNHASNYATDVELSNFGANTHLNLSKNGSTSTTAQNVIRDDNNSSTGAINVDTSGGNGTTTLVSTLPTLPAVVAPLLVDPDGGVEAAPAPDGSTPPASADPITMQLTDAQLAPLVAQAIANWEATGLTDAQKAYLQTVTFSVDDLAGVTLGAAVSGHVTLDVNAAGNGWFVDPTPGDNAEFPNGSGSELLTDPSLAPAGHVDLLTTIEHELGHELGLDDTYAAADRGSLMYGMIVDGERRLPVVGEADGATPGDITGQDFALGPVAIGTLPAGKSVTVSWQATIDPQTDKLIANPSNSGSVSGTNFSTFSTNTVSTSVDSLTLGNLVYVDKNHNGVFDSATESGINGVTVKLYADNGTTAGSFDAGDTLLATTTTAGGGLYSFTGLAPGDYIVQIPQSDLSGVLAGLRGQTSAGDPDDNTDGDNNGAVLAGQGIVSLPITLDYNSETTNDGTGHADTNNTLDIGLLSNAAPSGADNTVTANENAAYAFTAADFGFSDPNDTPPNTLLAVKIATLPIAGALTDNGVAVTAGQFVSVADITGGKLLFTPGANTSGAGYASFTFQVEDNGGTAGGGVDLDPTANALTVDVTAAAPGPVLVMTGSTGEAIEGGSPLTAAAAATITDISSPTIASATVQITGNFQAGDKLGIEGSQSGTFDSGAITFSFSGSTLTLTGADTLANYNAVLDHVTYQDTGTDTTTVGSHATRTLTWMVNDGSLPSTAQTTTLTIDRSAIVTTSGGSAVFLSGNGGAGTPVVVDSGLALSDLDGDAPVSAKVSITGGLVTGEDLLAFTNNNAATYGNVLATYTSATGTLALSSAGNTATRAQWQAALAAVTYGDSAASPTGPNRTINFVVNDGFTDSAAAPRTVKVFGQPVSVATFMANQADLDLVPGGFAIADTAANVGSFAALAAETADVSHIVSIQATDTPVVVGVGRFQPYQAALDKLVGGFVFVGQASVMQGDLDQIQSDLGHITSITALNGPVTVSVATFEAEKTVLDAIGSFAIADTAANIFNGVPDLQLDQSHIVGMTATDTPVAVGAGKFVPDQQVLDKLAGGFKIYGYVGPLGGIFDALTADISQIQSVAFADPTTPALNLTQIQATNDQSLLAKITSPYVLNADAGGGTTTTTGHGDHLTITAVAGQDTITGGGTSESFVFKPAFGQATVTDFYQHLTGVADDTISLPASEFTDFATMLQDTTAVGSDLHITAPSNSDTLILQHMTVTDLQNAARDFSFF